jgi:glutaredoxin
VTLTLYYRENCHLCESFRLALKRLQPELGFDTEEVDIDRDVDLVRRYDWLVPVLTLGDREICHYFLDEAALRGAIAADGAD